MYFESFLCYDILWRVGMSHQENVSVLVCYFISFIILLGSVK